MRTKSSNQTRQPKIQSHGSRRGSQVREFCSIAAAVKRGGARKDMYTCPQHILENKAHEALTRGLKLGALRNAPSSGFSGEDVMRARERLEQNLIPDRHSQGLTQEEKEEWAAFVGRTE